MAAKLILSLDGPVIREYPLNKERLTIGRKAHNDIVIDNLAVSGEHAVVITIMHDSFLEDMDSTNGMEVNGVRTKKHFLQNNDLIEIGKHKLRYVSDQITQPTPADFEKTMVLHAPFNQAPVGAAKADMMKAPARPNQPKLEEVIEKTGKYEAPVTATPAKDAVPSTVSGAPRPAVPGNAAKVAIVQILTGANAGRELELVKNLTTLGKPGLQVAVLTRRPHGYFITHVEGANFPSVNGQSLTNQSRPLNDHDVIELAGVKMEFYFKG